MARAALKIRPKSPLSRHGSVVTIEARVDARRRAKYKAALDAMRKASRNEASGFDAYWEAVGEVLDGELFVDGGYDTADAFLAAEVNEPRRTALRMVRIARWASPDEEMRYGLTKLDAALGYIEALTGGPIAKKLPIRFDALKIDVDGKKTTLDRASAQQVIAATRALLVKKGNSRVTRSPSEIAIARALEGVGALKGVAVHVGGGMLRLGAIPLHAVHDLVQALRGLELPAVRAPMDEASAKKTGAKTPAKKRAKKA